MTQTQTRKPPTSHEVGYVVQSQDYLTYIEGLPSVQINDIIKTDDGTRAIVASLQKTRITALVLDHASVKPGTAFTFASRGLQISVGDHLFGSIVSPIGDLLDSDRIKSIPKDAEHHVVDLDEQEMSIDERSIIDEQLITGTTIIDLLLPVGRGQRELMFGGVRSGKSPFIMDVIANQKGHHTICIYALIGRSELRIKQLAGTIRKQGSADYTIMVASRSNEPAALVNLTPYTALTIAEYYRSKGFHCLVVLDDLGTHAKYLREIALLSKRVPGRESYPGDIFHEHAHLIERAGNFLIKDKKMPLSITMLPIIQTNSEDDLSLIPTNLMSMTDGHLEFSSKLTSAGIYPSVSIPRSVTRVGRQTQTKLLRQLSDRVRTLLSEYEELQSYSRFGSELTADTQDKLKLGEVVSELIRQEAGQIRSVAETIILVSMAYTRGFRGHTGEEVQQHKQKLIEFIRQNKDIQKIAQNINDYKLDDLIKVLDTHSDTIQQTW